MWRHMLEAAAIQSKADPDWRRPENERHPRRGHAETRMQSERR
jgi:hypothetical protein